MKEYTYINVMGRTALKSGVLDRLRAIMQPYTVHKNRKQRVVYFFRVSH
jgi:hypothetical protein